MVGNHQLLVRGDHPDRHCARGTGDARRIAGVRFRIELNAEPGGGFADPASDLRRVLANACREYEPVDSAEHGCERADFLRSAIHEVVHSQPGGRLAALEQVAHVVADTRDA
jgi:hypothetical protein